MNSPVADLKCKIGKGDKYGENPNSWYSEHTLSQTKLSTTELRTWLERETGSILTPVQAKAQDHRDQTRLALQNLTEASRVLLDISQKEIDKRNMKVFNRARALNKLAALFIDRIKKLKLPEQVSFDNLSTFATETQKTLNVTEIDVRNWFPKISPFFIMDRRKFLTVYEKTKLTVNALNDFLNKEYVKSKTLEKTFQLIAELQTFERQLAEVDATKTTLQTERLRLEKEIKDLELQTVQLKGKAALEEVTRLDAETETLSAELKQTLSHLQKPFLKMQALATSGGGGGITPDELKMIGLYMETPFDAVTAEKPGLPTLKEILDKLTNLMAEDKLKLKPDKQRKAEQAVSEILKSDSLGPLQTRSLEVAARKKQLLASPELEEEKRCLSLIQQQMETLKTRKGNIETDENFKENQRQELLERIRGFKKTIESNVQSFMGKQIQVQ